MKLLFVHDHPFFKDDDGTVYTGGSFPFGLWDNYLKYFDEMTVYGRRSRSENSKNGITSGRQNMSFFLTEYYSSPVAFFKNLNSLRHELAELMRECDIVLVRLPSVLGFLAAHVAGKLGKTIWVEQVGSPKEALLNHGSVLAKIVAPVFDFLNKKLIRKAAYVSYVTKTKLQEDYPSSPHAITVALSDVLIDKVLTDSELDMHRFNDKKLRIGLIGGFDTRYKGQDILLRSINILEDEVKKNIEISFVGKGDYAWLVDEAKSMGLYEQIAYVGALEAGDQVNKYLSTLSLYIQPSLTEGMPRAIIEAMAVGCPVLGSNVGGIPDVVNEQFIHKKGDINKIADQIRFLFNNRDILVEEARSSLKKAEPYLRHNLDTIREEFYSKMYNASK